MNEEWREIPSAPGYMVSNVGRVARLMRPTEHPRDGRLSAQLGRAGKRAYVHRLVAEAFIGPAGDLMVNHIDGDPTNNRVENLEYVTRRGNIDHAIALGRYRGRGPTPSVLQRAAIQIAIVAGMRTMEIARADGVSHRVVYDMKRGRTCLPK